MDRRGFFGMIAAVLAWLAGTKKADDGPRFLTFKLTGDMIGEEAIPVVFAFRVDETGNLQVLSRDCRIIHFNGSEWRPA